MPVSSRNCCQAAERGEQGQRADALEPAERASTIDYILGDLVVALDAVAVGVDDGVLRLRHDDRLR